MTVAVIILNYNSVNDCRKCISYLQKQRGIELEMIIVDNCSKPEDIEQLYNLCAAEGCTLLESKDNRGYSAGNNIGLRYSAQKGYEYALIINPDMELNQPLYISRMIEKAETDDRIVVVGTDIVTAEGAHQNPLREPTYIEEVLWVLEPLRKNKTYMGDYLNSGFCEKLSGCCYLVKLSFMKEINFLDENVFLYSEEPILAKQVNEKGKKMYYMADISAIHMHLKSEKGNHYKRMKIAFESRKYYLEHYSGYPNWKLNILLVSKYVGKVMIFFLLKRKKELCIK